MEEDIIQPIDRDLLKSELTPDKQLRMTNKSHNEIYIVTANDSPNVLKEIGLSLIHISEPTRPY